MVLSISKLERLLTSKGLIMSKFYILHGMCIYIEVFNVLNTETFLVYIPSSYDIGCELHRSYNYGIF